MGLETNDIQRRQSSHVAAECLRVSTMDVTFRTPNGIVCDRLIKSVSVVQLKSGHVTNYIDYITLLVMCKLQL